MLYHFVTIFLKVIFISVFKLKNDSEINRMIGSERNGSTIRKADRFLIAKKTFVHTFAHGFIKWRLVFKEAIADPFYIIESW